MPELPLLGWVVLGVCALLVGVAKTSVGGLGAIAVAGFTMFLPARESKAAVLLVLIIGDIVAVSVYRRSADWAMLRRLLPAVVPGIMLGALLIWWVDDATMMLVIALCLLVAASIQVVQRVRARRALLRGASAGAAPTQPRGAVTVTAGVAAGFTTMVANAAGPVMALYLLAVRVDKLRFIGTSAWFFLVVNVAKVPFSVGLGLLPSTTFMLTVALAPAVLVGTWLGRLLVVRLDQRTFERATLTLSLLAAVLLLVRSLW